MKVEVAFQGERLTLDVPDDRLVVAWQGPAGEASAAVSARVAEALENPTGYPPLRQSVVPGDHVVVAVGHDVPEPAAVLKAVWDVLEAAGVARDDLTVLTDGSPAESEALLPATPEGVKLVRHDPDDRTQLAYLASTKEGRRVYLNRLLTDADLVVPVGRLAYDGVLGYQGPWGTLFPGLSDTETRRDFIKHASDESAARHPWPALIESTEVSWLLGSQFQLGVMAGVEGVAAVVAGLGTSVQTEGTREVDRAWGFRADERSELVVAGVGRPGDVAGIDDLGLALANATRLVRRGGKIVVLSRAAGAPGPALSRLIAAGDPRVGPTALKGHEADPDYLAARRIARALAWADVYLLSNLDPGVVDDLALISLDRPEEVRRLAAVSESTAVVSQADLARARVIEAND